MATGGVCKYILDDLNHHEPEYKRTEKECDTLVLQRIWYSRNHSNEVY